MTRVKRILIKLLALSPILAVGGWVSYLYIEGEVSTDYAIVFGVVWLVAILWANPNTKGF